MGGGLRVVFGSRSGGCPWLGGSGGLVLGEVWVFISFPRPPLEVGAFSFLV